MEKVFLIFTLFFLNVDLFAQGDCNIETNVESSYTLCNGTIDIPFSILNPEQFDYVHWIIGDEYKTGTNVNFSLNQAGLHTLTIQAGTDDDSCTDYENISFLIAKGPDSDNVTGNLNSSINNLNCLEPGSTHQATTEITSTFTPSSIYWEQSGETTAIDHTFDVVVGDNDVYSYPIQVQFDECNVDLVLDHPYTIQYETTFSNPYEGAILCGGEIITLTNTSPQLGLSSDFSWNIESAQIISETPNNISFYYTNEGTYNWRLDYNGSCLSTDEEDVIVNIADPNDSPNTSINSENIESCELPYNLNVNTTGSPSVGNLSYDWKLNSETTTITSSDSETFEYEIQNSGVYNLILEVTDDSLDCTTTDFITISVDDLNLDLNLNSISECADYIFNPMNSAMNSLGESVNYSWGIIADDVVLKNSTEENPSFTMEEPGTFDVSLTLSSNINNCDTTIFFEDIIEIKENPEVELSMGHVDVCEFPYEVTVTDTSDFDGNYSWALLNEGDTIEEGNNEAFTHNFETTGAYILSWENVDSITSCFSTQKIELNLDSIDIVLDSSEPFINYCTPYVFSPEAINLTEDFYGTYSYQWQLIDTLGEVYQTLNSVDDTFNVVNDGIYDLQLTVSNATDTSCFDQVILEDFVEVYDYDLELGILESNSCFSETVQTIEKTIYADFSAPPTLATNHNWEIKSSAEGVNTILNTSDTIKLAFTDAGNYTVTYTATIENSDCEYSKQISFGIDAIAEISVSSVICLGNQFTLTENPNAAVGTNTSFSWSSPNNELIIANPNNNPTTVSTDVAGTYDLQLTVVNDLGCTAIDSVSIEAYEVDASFSSPNTGEQCKPAIVEFNSLNNDYINSYTWNIYETTYLGVESDTTHLTYSPNLETLLNEIALYDVELIINSQHGCKDTMLIEDYVEVISPLPYFTLEPRVSCDTVYLDIIDSSSFIDSYTFDYGNGSTQGYDTLATNTAIYTYPPDSTADYMDYYLTLTTEYKFCAATFTDIVSVPRPVYPSAPSINYVTVESGGVRIEWSVNSIDENFDMIHLYHETASSQPNLIHSSNQITPNYFPHPTFSSQVNSYTVTQQDNCGNISDYSLLHSTILLNATSPSFETVDLSWTPYIGWDSIASYDIYRSVHGAPHQLLNTIPGNLLSYQDTNLCDVIHNYYVVANHPEENFQSHSNSASIIPDYVNYEDPLNLVYTSVLNDENIMTEWDYYASYTSDLISYTIDRWDDYFGWIINYDQIQQSPYIDTVANVHHRNYKYRVSYEDDCGNKGPDSNIGRNILLNGTQNASHYDLNWNSYEQWDDGVQEYIIQYYNQLTSTYQDITSVSNTTLNYIDSDLAKDGVDTSYCYRVVAVRTAATNTSYSNSRCFIPEPKNYFPNAFSPNNDGLNETFKYEGQFAKEMKAEIYNRWGNLVYSSDEIEFEWDGKNESTGGVCPQGSYIFQYELTGYDGTVIKDDMIIYLLK